LTTLPARNLAPQPALRIGPVGQDIFQQVDRKPAYVLAVLVVERDLEKRLSAGAG